MANPKLPTKKQSTTPKNRASVKKKSPGKPRTTQSTSTRRKPFCALEAQSMPKLRFQLDGLMPPREDTFDVLYMLQNHLFDLSEPKSWSTESGILLLTSVNIASYHHAELGYLNMETSPPDYTVQGDNITTLQPQQEAVTTHEEENDYGDEPASAALVQDIVDGELASIGADATALDVVRSALGDMTFFHLGPLKDQVATNIAKTWLRFLENLPMPDHVDHCAGARAQYFIPTNVKRISLAALAQEMETAANLYLQETSALSRDVMAVQRTELHNLVMCQLMLEIARVAKNFPRKLKRQVAHDFNELPHETAQRLKATNDFSINVIDGGKK